MMEILVSILLILVCITYTILIYKFGEMNGNERGFDMAKKVVKETFEEMRKEKINDNQK